MPVTVPAAAPPGGRLLPEPRCGVALTAAARIERRMIDREPLAACPLCAAPTASARPLEKYQKDHLVRCSRCGFNFSLLIPSAEDYERVYGAYNYEAEDAARSAINIENERALVERLMPYKKSGKVLDIAAGAGRFLVHFRDRGFEPYATEFSEPMCQYLEQRGITTFRGGLFPQGAPEGAFDVLVFTEIIEHINNPREVLAEIHRLLRPGGCLYLTTPNFDSLERRIIGPSWGMLMWPEHITYWTPKHLHRALRAGGFRKKSLKTQNISPFRIIEALQKGKMSSAVSGLSPQGFSDAAQEKVSGSKLLSFAKASVNKGLDVTNLGSSIRAFYEKA
jgi:2-polyprenyl-3-methyl-5-hydroxy-6-metoxy-1,4-benzoquinol methylase